MRQFEYTITDPMGMHARPAGQFVKEATGYESNITLTKQDKCVDAKKIFRIMGLSVKCNETVTITVEGPDEAAAAEKLEAFMKENM